MTLILPDRRIWVRNTSKLLTENVARKMVAACYKQLGQDFAPAWCLSLSAAMLAYAGPTDVLPPNAWVINLADSMDDPDALGYHTIDGHGLVSGVIGVKVVLDNGGKALTGPMSVASVLSHEVLELAADPFCSSWSDTGRGYLICTEVCDPVEGDSYVVDGVSVSNFVTPSWFNPDARGVAFDQMGRVHKPFTMSRGGYYVKAKIGTSSQVMGALFRRRGSSIARPELVFGPDVPDWVRRAKQSEWSRVGQRIAGRVGNRIT